MQAVNMSRLKDSIKSHEGLVLKPYKCSENFWTIGYGKKIHDLDAPVHETIKIYQEGITIEQAEAALNLQAAEAVESAREVVGQEYFDSLTPIRQEVLAEMVFQMGRAGLAKFKKTLYLIRTSSSPAAVAREMLDSKWRRQTPARAMALAERYRKDAV